MHNIPSIELLKSVHSFPGKYLFKVIGHADDGFLARAVAAIREATGADIDPPYSIRQSASGKHVAISFDVPVQTAYDVEDIYKRLITLKGLVALF